MARTFGSSRHTTAARKRHPAEECDERVARSGSVEVLAIDVVTTAIVGFIFRNEPSDSSASATSSRPDRASLRARVPIRPPMTTVGSTGAGQTSATISGGRVFPVGAGDRDAVGHPHQLGEHLRAGMTGIFRARLHDLGLSGWPRRDHHDVRIEYCSGW